jgi:hypothetical protein
MKIPCWSDQALLEAKLNSKNLNISKYKNIWVILRKFLQIWWIFNQQNTHTADFSKPGRFRHFGRFEKNC